MSDKDYRTKYIMERKSNLNRQLLDQNYRVKDRAMFVFLSIIALIIKRLDGNYDITTFFISIGIIFSILTIVEYIGYRHTKKYVEEELESINE